MLNERLNVFGILGCVLCISGSVTIVLHAPEEREIASLLQVWQMAVRPGAPFPPGRRAAAADSGQPCMLALASGWQPCHSRRSNSVAVCPFWA